MVDLGMADVQNYKQYYVCYPSTLTDVSDIQTP